MAKRIFTARTGLTNGTDERSGFFLGEPLAGDGNVDGGGVDLAAAVHFGGDGGGFLIVDVLDGLDVDLIGVPVGSVLYKNSLFLGLELAQQVSAAVQNVLGAVGYAELVALLKKERLVYGHEANVGEHALEVGAGLNELVNEGVIVNSLYAYGCEINGFGGCFTFLGGNGGVVVSLCAFNYGIENVGGTGSVGVVEKILGSGNKVVGRYVGNVFALVGYPGSVVAKIECPLKTVFGDLPLFCERRLNNAVLIVLNKSIDDVGGKGEVIGGGGSQIVERSYLAGIQRTEGIPFCNGGHREYAEKQRCAQSEYRKFFHLKCLLNLRFFRSKADDVDYNIIVGCQLQYEFVKIFKISQNDTIFM